LVRKPRIMRLAAALACMLALQSYLFVLGSGSDIGGQGRGRPMKVSVLDTKMGLFGADISPDGRFVAVDATKGTLKGGGLDLAEEVQIWDLRGTKMVARKILATEWLADPNAYGRGERFVRYSLKDNKLVICRNGHLQIFDSETLELIRDVDLGMEHWPKFPANSVANSYVADVEIDENAHRAAILLAWGPYGGGELRAYDLTSGEQLRQWPFEKVGFPGRGPISIDPAGRRIAIAVLPFSPGERRLRADEHNIFLLEIDSGKVISSINTGYISGAICFAPNDTVLSVSLNPEVKRFARDTLKVWNAETGKLIRELPSEPEGVHDSLHLSADGLIALGYVGLEKRVGDSNVTLYQRFRLWDLSTGNVIATSPDLLPMEEGGPRLRLSAAGNLVLVYPVGNADPLRLYQIH